MIRAAFGADGEPSLNRSYVGLAREYGFRIDPTPPRAPQKKGKVERTILYVKRNFFVARDFADVNQARRELAVWLREVAGGSGDWNITGRIVYSDSGDLWVMDEDGANKGLLFLGSPDLEDGAPWSPMAGASSSGRTARRRRTCT